MKNIIICLSLILFFACDFTREVEVDIPASKGVLNGIVFSDSILKVNVSSSYGTLPEKAVLADGFNFASQSLFIPDAEISFFLNGEKQGNLDPFDENGNYYMPDYIPRQGDEIMLEVKTDKCETLKSKTRIPEYAQILQVDTTVYTSFSASSWETNTMKINLEARISKKEKSYYLLSLSSWGEYIVGENKSMPLFNPRFITYPSGLASHADTHYLSYFIYPLNFIANDLVLVSNYIIFSNDFFEKETIQLSLEVPDIELSYYDGEVSFTRYFKIHMLSISPSFYRYLHSKLVQYESSDFIIDSDVYVTHPTFSNVEGGYGLFSSVCETEYEIKLMPGKDKPSGIW